MAIDLQNALDELRQTMGKMEMALGLIDEAIVWVDDDCVIEWCNRVFDRMVERSHIELIGAHLPDVLPLKELGTDTVIFPHPIEQLLNGQNVIQSYYEILDNGASIELAATPLNLPHKKAGYILTLRDVSNMQEEQQVRLQSMALHAAADAIAITGEDGTIEWVNRAFTALTGYSAEEVRGQEMHILQSGQTPQLAYKNMWETILSGAVWKGELINRRKDGCVYNEEQSVTPVHDRDGAIRHYIAIKRDISERKRAELEIKKLSSVATHTDNSVIITNAEGEIEWVNAAFCRMTEHALNEVIGRRPGSFLQGPDTDPETIKMMREDLKANNAFNVEIINYSKSGRKYWLSIEVRPLYDDNGKIVNFLGIESDISERKHAEEREEEIRSKEMDIAGRIQRTLLLGKDRQRIRNIQMAAMTFPSQLVDGDFFDCFIHSDNCMDIVIGDVMGKGVPAALLGAATKSALLRSLSSMLSNSENHKLPSTEEILTSLHASMAKQLIELDSFVTLVYARFCGQRQVMQFVDCGHTRTILCHQNSAVPELLSGSNTPLGFMAREQYIEHEIALTPGDVVVMYSDGITEAEDQEGNMFGEDRLIEAICKGKSQRCEKILEGIHLAIEEFTKNDTHSFSDDLTCLVIKVDEQQSSELLAEHTFEYKAELTQLEQLGNDLLHFSNQHLSDPYKDLIYELHIGVNEAAMNIIQHAFYAEQSTHATLRMRLSIYAHRIEAELHHNGRAFSGVSCTLPEPQGFKENGYGLYIMDHSMDAVHYTRMSDGWNRVLMIKELNGE